MHWVMVFGPPRVLSVDPGGENMSAALEEVCELFGIRLVVGPGQDNAVVAGVERVGWDVRTMFQKIAGDVKAAVPGVSLQEIVSVVVHTMNNALRSLAGHTPQELATGTRAMSMFDQRKEACATGFGGATKDRMRAFEEARVAVLKHTTVEAHRAASKDHRRQ